MIKDIVDSFIADESDCLGQLVNDHNFNDLEVMVLELRAMGRSTAWKLGIDTWLQTIDYAHKTFCDQTGCGYKCNNRLKDYTHTTQRDYANALKYAVCVGAWYATCGNH
jgi:hypothetical protein